jgi:hypothetical protein
LGTGIGTSKKCAENGINQSLTDCRTARVPTEATNQLPPEEFAHILIQKLEKVKQSINFLSLSIKILVFKL